MGTTADNVATLKDTYTRWHETKASRDDMWLDIMADNVRVKSLGAGREGAEFTATVQSKHELHRYFQGLHADWEMDYDTPTDFVADGDTAVALCKVCWTNRRTTKKVTTPKADVAVFKDGKIVKWYEYYDTAALMAATQA
jgi:uncharacterized protein